MTDAPHLSNDTPQPDWADRMELAVLDAAIVRAPALGWNKAKSTQPPRFSVVR